MSPEGLQGASNLRRNGESARRNGHIQEHRNGLRAPVVFHSAPCPTCNPFSASFDALHALQCSRCFQGESEFDSINDFERHLTETQPQIAISLVKLDEDSIPKTVSKKRQKRDRVERLKQMTAAVGRETLEKKPKRRAPPKNPVVTLTFTGDDGQKETPVVYNIH